MASNGNSGLVHRGSHGMHDSASVGMASTQEAAASTTTQKALLFEPVIIERHRDPESARSSSLFTLDPRHC